LSSTQKKEYDLSFFFTGRESGPSWREGGREGGIDKIKR
jgi:hypothetical protein